jgi:thiol-disulfide isomerase/thioredoxin
MQPSVTEQKIVEAPLRDPAMQQLVEQAGLALCPVGVNNPDAAIPGLPNVELPCLGDGPPVNLSTLRGIPLVVNVWASWCPPCIEEMPILAQAARELEGTVQFIGIDYQDDPALGLELLTAMGVEFPSVIDSDASVRAPLAIPGPPVTYFVNPDGVIAGRWDGSITSEQALATLIETYLGVTW